MNYALLNSSGICTNLIIWDGQSEWQSPDDCTLVLDTDFSDHPTIGNTYDFNDSISKWIDVTPEISFTEEELEKNRLEKCNYFAFWDALLVSDVYQTIRQQASTDLNVNVCCTEFISVINDAKIGRANKEAIQSSINFLTNSLTLNEIQITEIISLFEIGNMSDVYTIPHQ